MANIRPKSKISLIETNSSTGVCYLCGYRGQIRPLSIKNDAFSFLRYVLPASGATAVTESSTYVQLCHLCALLLEEQKKLDRSTTNFFFKGFFRSNGACDRLKILDDEQRSPPPLRKSSPIEEISSSNDFLETIHTEFLSSYQSILSSSSSSIVVDSCQLCFSVKPHGTLYRLSQSQFPFFSREELDLCTLCYYNLIDQYKIQVKNYRPPRAECYLCQRHIDFVQWETKLFETELLPFLLTLHDEIYRRNHLYDEQRLALACDQCFFSILFQFLDQERRQIPRDQRIYSWQAFYSRENDDKRLHELNNELFYSSKEKTIQD